MKYLQQYGQLHHTGIAAQDFEQAISLFESIGYQTEGPKFTDVNQGVMGQFLTLNDHRIEVLSDLPGQSTLTSWIKNSAIIPYHFGYLVPDLDSALANIKSTGMRVVREPRPAVAFEGRRVVFLASRSRLLIELIEK